MKYVLKLIMPRTILSILIKCRYIINAIKPMSVRTCNICGYEGFFEKFGRPMRIDAMCPNCSSLERHRLLYLAIQNKEIDLGGKESKILHFAPEPILEQKLRSEFVNYKTADLYAPADLKLNIEDLDLQSSSLDVVIANHVMEHVDDIKATHEIARVLKKGGIFICQVPIVEGWDFTYESIDIVDERDRWLHYGQGDHVRYYGKDFRKRLSLPNFKLSKEVTSEGGHVIKYGLIRGEKVFVFKKG